VDGVDHFGDMVGKMPASEVMAEPAEVAEQLEKVLEDAVPAKAGRKNGSSVAA
jgi:hypothetical protein